MTKYESIKKELLTLYTAKNILEKYNISTRSLERRIATCERNLKLFLWRDKK